MRTKWVLIIVAVLIVVALVAVYTILSSYDFNKFKPMVAEAVMNSTGRELTMAGDIKLGIGFRPALVVEDVSFQNAGWGSRPQLAMVKRFKVQVALIPLISGDIEIKRLILIEPDILIETNAAGESNLKFEKPPEAEGSKKEKAVTSEAELPALTFNSVRIENGLLAYKDGKSDKTHTVTISAFSAVAKWKTSPVEIDLKGNYNEKLFEAEGTVGPIEDLINSDRSWPLKLTAKAGGAVVSLDGAIRDAMHARGIDMNVVAEGRSISDVALLADVTDVPDLGPFKVTAKVTDPAAKGYRLSNLEATLGENDLAGSAEITLADKRPYVKATLTSRKIDLRPLLKEGKDGNDAAEPKSKKDRIFPKKPLPLDSMKLVDAQASIRAQSILLPKLALNDLTAEVLLEDGALTVKPVKAVIGGGSMDGNVALNAKAALADLDVAMHVKGLDLGRMLAELDITDVIEGKLDAELQLSGSGESIAGLMAGLNGKTVVIMGNGRINNKYIDLLGADLRSGVFRLLNPFQEKKEYTEVNCFVSRFDISDGLAESTALVLDTSGISVIGDGRVNLKTEGLGLSLKPAPKQGIGTGEVGNVSLSLGELVKPFKLGGTLANPRLAIDPTQSAIALGKAYGGVVLFGPVGIAAALASRSSGDENPCLAAIEAAETGVKVSEQEGEKGAVGQAAENVTEGTKDAVGEAGQTLKKLFGR